MQTSAKVQGGLARQRKILIPLLLIVLLPLLLLSFAAWRMVQSERNAVAHQVQSLIAAQLQSLDDTLQDYFRRKQQQYDSELSELLQMEPEALSAELDRYKREQPGLRQVFLVDAEGRRVYPPEPLNADEQRFLERSSDFWNNLGGLQPTLSGSESVNDEPASSFSKKFASQDQIESLGWYVWQWGTATHLMYWRWDENKRLWGFELDPSYLLAELIAELPATSANELARWQLLDANGGLLYQWGDYEPELRQQPELQRLLSHPLGSWSLSYFAPSLTFGRSQLWLIALASVAVVGIVLSGLAWFLYREHQREMHLAQQRVNFVNQVSHELKTPLTNIRLYAELLDAELLDDQDAPRRYLDVIVSESQRLSRLINNVLSFAGWQKKRLNLRLRPAVFDDVVKAAIETFRPLLATKQIAIHAQLQAAETANLDPDALEQILNNLFGNVEKYVPSGGEVSISTWQSGEQSFIQVQDNGPGIAPGERGRIFEPFYRIGSALTEGSSGAGLGLTISRELARLHGGELELLEAKKGACFRVRIKTEAMS